MEPYRIASIDQYHRLRGLARPEHPLISVVRIADIGALADDEPARLVQDFYSVALKADAAGLARYGQGAYDGEGGKLFCIAPGQVYSLRGRRDLTHEGWLLLAHPDFFWGTPLAGGLGRYGYFDYAVHEALHLTGGEEATLVTLLRQIEREGAANVDAFSKSVIVAQVSLLLTYVDRFYHRQFLTRDREGHALLTRLERLLDERFADERLCGEGVPSVREVSRALHLSPNYLSALLKALTGRSTQEHIHDKLIAEAKARLSVGEAPVGAIAHALGFGYAQSFSKLFKAKTGVTPTAFRRSFN